jgi:hypothetical protein
MNVSIEVVDIIARSWGRLDVQILRLKRLPLRGVGLVVFTFRLRKAHSYICG